MAKLTAATIRKLKPGRYSDDDCIGLYLEVSETNRRSWLYRYKLKGKPHSAGLGNIADVSSPEARDKAADMRKVVRDGVDPIEQRRTARLAGAAERKRRRRSARRRTRISPVMRPSGTATDLVAIAPVKIL